MVLAFRTVDYQNVRRLNIFVTLCKSSVKDVDIWFSPESPVLLIQEAADIFDDDDDDDDGGDDDDDDDDDDDIFDTLWWRWW